MSGAATTLNPGFDIYATYLRVLEDKQVGRGVSKLRNMLLKDDPGATDITATGRDHGSDRVNGKFTRRVLVQPVHAHQVMIFVQREQCSSSSRN